MNDIRARVAAALRWLGKTFNVTDDEMRVASVALPMLAIVALVAIVRGY